MTDTTLSTPKIAPASPYRAEPATGSPRGAVEKADPSSAKLRLEASRARVRSALMEIAHPPKRPSFGWIDKLRGTIEDIPCMSLAIDTAKSWLHEHRETAKAAGQASQALIAPVARRHPGGVLSAAIALGAAMVLFKPWRLLLRRNILFGALSLVASQAIRSRSIDQWLQLLTKPAGNRVRPRQA